AEGGWTMECRKTLLAALCLVCTGLGCVGTTTVLKKEDTPPGVSVAKESDLPKRSPKASTCVAFGDFWAKELANPALAPPLKQLMFEQGQRAYQQALKIDPKCLPAYMGLARLYSGQGDEGKAEETYQKALKKLPKEASVWFALGMCHSRQKQWEPALKELQTAARLEP